MPFVATAVEQRGQVDEPGLISRVLAGDRDAARVLYDAHAPRIYRLIHRLTGDPELGRELTQDTFVRAFAQLARFRGEAALATWLHRIAITVTSNGMRKVRRLRERETPFDDAFDEGSGEGRATAGRDGMAMHARAHPEVDPDLRTRLGEAIDALPESLRVTVVMHDIEGYTHAEIAAAMGVAEGTSKSRLFDARARLRVALADFAADRDITGAGS